MARKQDAKELARKCRLPTHKVGAEFTDKSKFLAIKYDINQGITVSETKKEFYDLCCSKYGWQ